MDQPEEIFDYENNFPVKLKVAQILRRWNKFLWGIRDLQAAEVGHFRCTSCISHRARKRTPHIIRETPQLFFSIPSQFFQHPLHFFLVVTHLSPSFGPDPSQITKQIPGLSKTSQDKWWMINPQMNCLLLEFQRKSFYCQKRRHLDMHRTFPIFFFLICFRRGRDRSPFLKWGYRVT